MSSLEEISLKNTFHITIQRVRFPSIFLYQYKETALGAVSRTHVRGKLAPKLVCFILEKELLNCMATVPRFIILNCTRSRNPGRVLTTLRLPRVKAHRRTVHQAPLLWLLCSYCSQSIVSIVYCLLSFVFRSFMVCQQRIINYAGCSGCQFCQDI